MNWRTIHSFFTSITLIMLAMESPIVAQSDLPPIVPLNGASDGLPPIISAQNQSRQTSRNRNTNSASPIRSAALPAVKPLVVPATVGQSLPLIKPYSAPQTQVETPAAIPKRFAVPKSKEIQARIPSSPLGQFGNEFSSRTVEVKPVAVKPLAKSALPSVPRYVDNSSTQGSSTRSNPVGRTAAKTASSITLPPINSFTPPTTPHQNFSRGAESTTQAMPRNVVRENRFVKNNNRQPVYQADSRPASPSVELPNGFVQKLSEEKSSREIIIPRTREKRQPVSSRSSASSDVRTASASRNAEDKLLSMNRIGSGVFESASKKEELLFRRAKYQEDLSPNSESGQVVQTQLLQDSGMMNGGFGDNGFVGGIIFPRTPQIVVSGGALYMNREGGSFSFADSFSLDPFDYELGYRLTLQSAVGGSGPSLTYSGVQEWNDVFRANSAGGGLGIDSVGGGGLAAGALTPFNGATFQQQYHNANIHTLEFNQVTWGWDVLNFFVGARYTQYEEEFDFFSSRADGQQGLLSLDLENHVFGPQIGGEIFYDVGGLISTGIKGKIGTMATALDRNTLLISNGTRVIDTEDDDVKFNFMAELEGFVRFQFMPNGYIRGGYEMWYNSAIFTVNENIPGVITPTYGQTTNDQGLFIHGGTCVLEFVW